MQRDLCRRSSASVPSPGVTRDFSPARAGAPAEELNAVRERWRAEEEQPDQPPVHVLVDVFRLAEYPA